MATTSTISTTSSIMLAQPHEEQASTSKLQPPTDDNTKERLKQIDELKYFLGTATNDWDVNRQVQSFPLPTGESLSCVFWNDLFHVTGTDIVRTLLYRFHLFGRPVTNLKKFEEGIFSDLRNLKPGMDASLEEPKSEFLEMLYKNNCIRTQKKQKVFFWFSVPHDRLFLDALERDLKREKMGLEPTSVAIAEPATSLSLDTTQELFDQLRKSMSLSAVATAHAIEEEVNSSSTNNITTSPTTSTALPSDDDTPESSPDLLHNWSLQQQQSDQEKTVERLGHRSTRSLSSIPNITIPSPFPQEDDYGHQSYSAGTSPKSSAFELAPSSLDCDESEKQKIFGAFSLFEGSPTYKQRQRRRTLSFNANGLLYSGEDDYCGKSRLELAAINAGLAILHPQAIYPNEVHQSPEKVYTCPLPQCARLFKRLEHLKRHFRTHTMERPYSCNMCGKHFSRTDNLAQHKKTHNRGARLTRSISSGGGGSTKTLSPTSKLSSINNDEDLTKRKRASSLRNSYNYNEIIDKLSVLTSDDIAPLPAPVDYFSYQGGDMSRCASNSSPNHFSDEEVITLTNYEDVIPFNITEEDTCMMTDEYNNNIMYDEEEEIYLPHYSQEAPSCSSSSSFNQTQQLSWYSSYPSQKSLYDASQIYLWQQQQQQQT
ncbi:unnamed protein product [Mucor hiemalis]